MNKMFSLCIMIISFLWVTNFNVSLTYASLPESQYYQITSNNAIFYRTQKLDDLEAYFILPSTYFVKLNYEVDDNTLAVSYLDINGFVKKENVTKVYSTPSTPYLNNVSFSPNAVANLVLRSTPSTQGKYLGTIPFSASLITYLGSIEGEKVYESLSNVWYFCRYTSIEQGTVTGYVYAPLTCNLSAILPNTEEVAYSPIVPSNADIILSPELQSTSNLILIILLTIPALFIIYLILKSNKNKRNRSLKREFKRANHLSLRAPPDDELNF
ncbi:MAG: hypothetical protein IKQ31_02835 [Clostridia bacterium]|nr:hypothetical protein [Clostridia bacterium]